jgi:hypothetical protein
MLGYAPAIHVEYVLGKQVRRVHTMPLPIETTHRLVRREISAATRCGRLPSRLQRLGGLSANRPWPASPIGPVRDETHVTDDGNSHVVHSRDAFDASRPTLG